MATSLFNSILSMVDSRTIGDVAQSLGQPAQAVSRGMESSVATLLSGLASKSDNPGVLRQILDAVPSTLGTTSWSQAANAASDPNSSLMRAGKGLLSSLFGDGGNIVTNSISRSVGLTPGATTTLLTMVAPMVMGFISKHVSDTGMSMNGLAGLLQRETSTFKSALPSGLSEYFWPTKKMAATASPVIAQTVQRETASTPNWLLPLLAAAALILGFGWLFSHLHRPVVSQVVSVPRGAASRFGVPAATPVCVLPSGVTLPAGGAEARMLSFIQDPNAKISQDTWFNADQTLFDSGSARLKPGAQAQLSNVAAILASCPNVHLKVAGYTDNVGSADSNLRLSQSRANGVVAQLVDKGVSSDRLTTEGFGEQYPVADNATDEGRAQNRRVAMCVIKK